MSRPDAAGGTGVRLDLLVARYGPMPEEMVRALGCVLARAMAAQRALGRADGLVDPVHIEVFAGGPRLLELDSDGVTVPLAAGDEIAAIARVMVFAAAGGPSGPESLPVSPGLRELLQACLSDGPRPSLAELAQLLDGPPPAVWLPAEPTPSTPIPSMAGSTTAVPQQFPMPASSPPGRSQRVPWLITAACWAVIALVATGTAVALDVRDDGGPPSYDAALATNLCELLDLPPLEKLGGKAERPPENSPFDYPGTKSLLCFGSFEHGSLSANLTIGTDVATSYRSGKAVTLGTTSDGVTSGTRSEIGEDSYFSVTKPERGGSVGCVYGFIDGNLTMDIRFTVYEDPGTSRDDLIAVCEHQARTVREQMR